MADLAKTANFLTSIGAGLSGQPPGIGMNFAMRPHFGNNFAPQRQFPGFNSNATGDWGMLLNGLAMMGRPQPGMLPGPMSMGGCPTAMDRLPHAFGIAPTASRAYSAGVRAADV